MTESGKRPHPLLIYKIAITLISLAIMAVRILYPDLKIDATSLGLLALAILPWLSPFIKSAELPGLGKVEFQEVRAAAERAAGGEQVAPLVFSPSSEPSYFAVADLDPRLALVGLRIEIEKRLRSLAERVGVWKNQPLLLLMRDLENKHVLQSESAIGLRDLIILGNQAAHGATVDPKVASMSVEYAPRVLGLLDAKLVELERPNKMDSE